MTTARRLLLDALLGITVAFAAAYVFIGLAACPKLRDFSLSEIAFILLMTTALYLRVVVFLGATTGVLLPRMVEGRSALACLLMALAVSASIGLVGALYQFQAFSGRFFRVSDWWKIYGRGAAWGWVYLTLYSAPWVAFFAYRFRRRVLASVLYSEEAR